MCSLPEYVATSSATLGADASSSIHRQRSAEFLSQSDENIFRTADVTEPIRVFILDNFAHELGAARAESLERLVEVVHGEHDAQIAESVHRGAPMIRDDARPDEPGEL